MRQSIIVIFIFGIAAVMIGCAANPALPPVKDKGDEPETLPMIALEVYRDESNFFVKYRYGSKALYAGSNARQGRVDR